MGMYKTGRMKRYKTILVLTFILWALII